MLAYTMFNVYFPKLIELRLGKEAAGGSASRKHAMWDVVSFTIGGMPGAIVSLTHTSLSLVSRDSDPDWTG